MKEIGIHSSRSFSTINFQVFSSAGLFIKFNADNFFLIIFLHSFTQEAFALFDHSFLTFFPLFSIIFEWIRGRKQKTVHWQLLTTTRIYGNDQPINHLEKIGKRDFFIQRLSSFIAIQWKKKKLSPLNQIDKFRRICCAL